MHILTCDILQQGAIGYAMIPTYFKPSKFIAAKVYIEYVWFGERTVFYHCMIQELLDDINTCMDILPTALVRCIDKQKHKPCLMHFVFNALSMTKIELQNDISAWHARYLLDVPAPFIVSNVEAFDKLRNDISQYFKSL